MTTADKSMTSRLTPTPSAPVIGAGYAKGLLAFAVSKGADRATLLARSNLKAADVEDLDARIPLARYVALFEAAAELLDEPALALHYGQAVRIQDVSIVGLICEACETTLAVGTQLNRYMRLFADDGSGASGDLVRLVRRDEGIWMEGVHWIYTASRFVTEAETSRLVSNTRAMFANNADFQAMRFPVAIQFTHQAPNHAAEYERIFQCPVAFGAPSNAIQIDPRFLTLRQPPVNRYVFGLLSERAEALLRSVENTRTTRARVESLLIPLLHEGEPGMERIADAMGLGEQTLYRKLKAEGTTFEKLLDELRHKMALHYLDGKKVSVNETAYLVGFSNPSVFSRAFRRWTGTSPGKRRR
jgi:AraC-like DNA-binding protein